MPGMSDHPADYVSIASAAGIAGIPERTLREWVHVGKLSAIAGKRGKLVNLDDVRHLAVVTGRQPAIERQVAGNNIVPAGFAGNLAELLAKIELQTELIGTLVAEVERLRGLVEALPNGVAGTVAELPSGPNAAVPAAPEPPASPQNAGPRVSEAVAPAPDTFPIEAHQERTAPFWRSWWQAWQRRHP